MLKPPQHFKFSHKFYDLQISAGFKQSTITTTSDKLKNRLEEIDDMEEVQVLLTADCLRSVVVCRYCKLVENINFFMCNVGKSRRVSPFFNIIHENLIMT